MSFRYGRSKFKQMKLPIPMSEYYKQSSTLYFFSYPLVRIWSRYAYKLALWESKTFNFKPYVVDMSLSMDLAHKIEKGHGPKWDRIHSYTLGNFDVLLDNLKVGDSEYSVRYMHFTFTHFPVDFDADCVFRANDPEWFKNNQNRKGVVNEAICGIKKYIAFLDIIKKLGIYNNSLIVLKSDHGKLVKYYSKYPNNLKINGNNHWGYNRYLPTLLIKGFNSSSDSLTQKDELVLLNDLANTLCIASQKIEQCTDIPGVNLLSDNLDDGKGYYLYVAKDAKSTFKFETQKSVTVPSRKYNLLESMLESELIKLNE